jgi:phenylacetate-CoA ligase
MRVTPLERWIAAKIGGGERPLSLAELHSYQLERLNQTISLAQDRSRFYRRLLGEERMSLSSLEELGDLPFTTAEQLGSAPFEFLCVRQDEVERIVTLPTSGTTGAAKRVFFTADDQELTKDFFRWGMSTMVEAGDRVLILLPGHLPGSVGDLLKEALARMDVRGIIHGPVTDPRHTLGVMERERVTALVGIPVQVLWLARVGGGNGDPRSLRLKSVLLTTDHVPDAIVGVIEDTWGCDVYNHYGMTEMGLGGGVDCQARAGYHVREADLFFEVVDPVSGRPVAKGDRGELVFTTLTRGAMPLIRYRTGDVSRIVPEPCPCGSVLERLAHVDQRLSGIIGLPGGRLLCQKDFDEALFAIDGLMDFQVLFTGDYGRESIALQVKYRQGGPRPSKHEIVQALLHIRSLSDEAVGGRISVEVSEWTAADASAAGTAKRTVAYLREDEE